MPPLTIGKTVLIEGDIKGFSFNTKGKQIAKITTKNGKTYIEGIKVGTGGVLTRTTGGPHSKPGSWRIDNLKFNVVAAPKKK